MPLQIPPKAPTDTTIYGFGGVDLRQDVLAREPSTLLEAIDFDLHVTAGVATARQPGRAVATLDNKVQMIKRAGHHLYAGTQSGTLYQDFTQIGTGFGTDMTVEEYTRENATEPEIYIASTGGMKRLVRGAFVSWGLERPIHKPVLSPLFGLESQITLDGRYSVVYTYVVKEGNTLVLESNPSIPSEISVRSVFITAVNSYRIALAATVQPPTDPQVTHIRIYRSQGDGSIHLFDTEVTNTGAAQTIWLTKIDDHLGAAVDEDNTPPPITSRFIIHGDRAWLADDYQVYYSKKFRLESFPFLNFLPVGTRTDPIIGLVSSRFGIGVFTRRRRFRILESVAGVQAIGDTLPFFGGSTENFIPVPSPIERGGVSRQGIADSTEGVIYAADDGLYVTDFGGLDQQVSDPIGGLFTGKNTANLLHIDRGSRSNAVVGVHNSKRYLSYTEDGYAENNKTAVFSSSTGAWYFYDLGLSAIYSDPLTDYLYAGAPDGTVRILDDYDGQRQGSITATLTTARLHGGLPNIDKLMQWLHVSATVDPADSLTGELYVEEALATTFTVTGSNKIRVADGIYGKDFRVSLTFSGANPCQIRGLQLIWLPMRTI